MSSVRTRHAAIFAHRATNCSMTMLRFHAQWCGPCKSSAPAWEKFKAERSDVSFVDVDIDEDLGTTMKYGVMSVPTVISIDEDGKVLKRHVGGFTLPILQKTFL